MAQVGPGIIQAIPLEDIAVNLGSTHVVLTLHTECKSYREHSCFFEIQEDLDFKGYPGEPQGLGRVEVSNKSIVVKAQGRGRYRES